MDGRWMHHYFFLPTVASTFLNSLGFLRAWQNREHHPYESENFLEKFGSFSHVCVGSGQFSWQKKTSSALPPKAVDRTPFSEISNKIRQKKISFKKKQTKNHTSPFRSPFKKEGKPRVLVITKYHNQRDI